MINGLISVMVVFVLLGVGFYFTYTSKWPDNTNQVFSTAVVKIAAPSLAVISIAHRFTPELLISAFWNLILITVTIFIMHLIGQLFSRIFHLEPKKKAVFITTFTFNNTMFIGLPINHIVFGDDGLPYLFTFYLVTITLFWSLGAFTLSRASDKADTGFSIRKIFSPGLVGVIIGCLLAGFQITLPVILDTSLTYLGNLTVPLSLLVIGSNLAFSYIHGIPRISRDKIAILVGKFVLHPLLIWGIFSLVGALGWLNVTGLPLHVFILTASLPCHAQTAIVAQYYEVEGEYASGLVSLSTLISLITIPLYAGILLS
ncbi:MAG: AEC family transporter [Lentihominibacter sp.]|jgi:predicted permease